MGKLGFGLMRLPQRSSDGADIDIEKLKEMADKFISEGGTYFDTAYVYHGGKSENAFKEAVVKRYSRESFTIADKLPVFSIDKKEQVESIFNEQLERCGVDYFDYYLLHALGADRYDNVVKRFGCFEFISKMKKEGKIRHIGFSFHDSAEVLDRILSEHPEVEFVQLQINYLDWDDKNVQSEKCYNTARRHGKQVVIMEPIKGGALANLPDNAAKLLKKMDPEMSYASWAIRYAASLEGVITVLSGMSNMDQMEDNLSYMKDFKPLTKEETADVLKTAELIRSTITVPCTGCRYCVDDCPKKIPIPEYFSIYNDYMRFSGSQKWEAKSRYSNAAKDHGKASECIKCGKCESHCPQHLEIRENLKTIASEFE